MKSFCTSCQQMIDWTDGSDLRRHEKVCWSQSEKIPPGEFLADDDAAIAAAFASPKKPSISAVAIQVAEALEQLDGEARGRVLRAVAVLLGIKGGLGAP